MSEPNVDWQALLERAFAAREDAYAPYSRFAVGAAALCEDGEIVSGCNIENASYGLTMCAERTALYAARARGKRGVVALCVAGPPDRFVPPCGACRQVMWEYNAHMLVGCAAPGGVRRFRLEELLPAAFGPDELA